MSEPRLRFVFFDLYGTLVDIVTDEAARDTTARFGLFVAERFGAVAAQHEQQRPFVLELHAIRPPPGKNAEPDIAPVVGDHLRFILGRAPTDREVGEAAAAFRVASRRELTLFPGVKEALAALRPHFGIGLISNAQFLFTRPELIQLSLDGLFEPQVISSQAGWRKPSARIFQHALEKAHCAPHAALHVGNDPRDDIEGAFGAGLHTCLVGDPRHSAATAATKRPEQYHSTTVEYAVAAGFSEEWYSSEVRREPELHLASVAQLPQVLLGPLAPTWVGHVAGRGP